MVSMLHCSAQTGRHLLRNDRFHFSTRSQRLRSMSDVIDADLEEFEELQKIVSDYLNANDSSKANAM